MAICSVPECNQIVTKAGFLLCYNHWKDEKDGFIVKCESCGAYKDNDYPLCTDCFKTKKSKTTSQSYSKQPVMGKTLSSTAIGKKFELSPRKINQILAELGWIFKYTKGWKVSPDGLKHGGNERKIKESGVPYVVWSTGILDNEIFTRTISEFKGEYVEKPSNTKKDSTELGFREKFPGTHRTADGHFVRSRAEMLIDNHLYASGIVHAFERKLPVKDDAYCDFYLPEKKVYIEYWGLEDDPKYAARKKKKQEIYKKHDFKLIELSDKHINNLDDFLTRKLLDFGINVDG